MKKQKSIANELKRRKPKEHRAFTVTNSANPYGGEPGGGITLPSYYRPTPSVDSANNYFPRGEQLGPSEMRISFIGIVPFLPTKVQAGTCIMVELGNGKVSHA